MMRINKYIASTGTCSRRKADELIQEGKVSVNGNIVTNLGEQIDETKDSVYIYGSKISLEEKKIYIMLNKPKGYITTNSEQFSRQSTVELIHEDVRVFPIGRLDMYTEGLLLLTNDGEFANKLMHPRNKIEKTYIATTKAKVTDEQIKMLTEGVDIGDYITKPAKVHMISKNQVEIKISEGKNRQIRRMFDQVGAPVLFLKRIAIGGLKLGDLNLGEYKILNEEEIGKLFN